MKELRFAAANRHHPEPSLTEVSRFLDGQPFSTVV